MTILRLGSSGIEVEKLQRALGIKDDGDFGPKTEKAVKAFQKKNGLTQNGVVDEKTWAKLTTVEVQPAADKYKDVTIKGSTFPGKPYSKDVSVSFSKEMINEYLPTLEAAMPNASKGLKLLLTIMAHKEGFYKGTRSYTTNNPGNIGNTDSGANQKQPSLKDGILLQKDYVEKVVNGKHPAYPMNKSVKIKPYYSPEIAKNQKTYGLSPYLSGYEFVFTGQLDQYVKIYSTGARGGNSYINMIMSYFKKNGLDINPESKIQDIILLQ